MLLRAFVISGFCYFGLLFFIFCIVFLLFVSFYLRAFVISGFCYFGLLFFYFLYGIFFFTFLCFVFLFFVWDFFLFTFLCFVFLFFVWDFFFFTFLKIFVHHFFWFLKKNLSQLFISQPTHIFTTPHPLTVQTCLLMVRDQAETHQVSLCQNIIFMVLTNFATPSRKLTRLSMNLKRISSYP